MSKPNKPPQITSFALTQEGEESALWHCVSWRFGKKQKQFVIPKGSGELLCWSTDDMKYQNLPYVEKANKGFIVFLRKQIDCTSLKEETGANKYISAMKCSVTQIIGSYLE